MISRITIPANQNCAKGELLKVIIDSSCASGLEIYMKCDKLTMIGNQPIKFSANRFTPWNRRHSRLPDQMAALTQTLT